MVHLSYFSPREGQQSISPSNTGSNLGTHNFLTVEISSIVFQECCFGSGRRSNLKSVYIGVLSWPVNKSFQLIPPVH